MNFYNDVMDNADELELVLADWEDEQIIMDDLIERLLCFGCDDTCDIVDISVPEDENLVFVYDRSKEREYLKQLEQGNAEEGVTCRIKEKNFEIHVTCYACRKDSTGDYISLQDGDEEILNRYLHSEED